MFYRLTEVGQCYEIEMNAGKKLNNENLKGLIPYTGYDRSGTTVECRIIHIFG
jgi:hypothetical protein